MPNMPSAAALLAWLARFDCAHPAVERWRPVIESCAATLPTPEAEWLRTPLDAPGTRHGSGARDRRRSDLLASLDVVAWLAPRLRPEVTAACLDSLGEVAPSAWLNAEQRERCASDLSAIGARQHAPLHTIRDRWRPWLLALAAGDAVEPSEAATRALGGGLRPPKVPLIVALRALIAGR